MSTNNSVKRELDKIVVNNGIMKLNESYYIPHHTDYILKNKGSLTDTLVDDFIAGAIKVIEYSDPSLEFEPKYREAQRLINSVEPIYSENLKKSIIESLAVLYNNQEQFVNCSTSYIERRITESLKAVYDENSHNWKFWYTNRRNLQTLAQINPELYLNTIKTVIADNKLIAKLNQQTETVFSFSNDSLYEIRLSIQTLAYSESFFTQCIQLLLLLSKKEIDDHDNKSLDAIVRIANPYHPQTNFPEKDIPNAILKIITNNKDKLYIYKKLLPHNFRTWSETIKPVWLKDCMLYKNATSINEKGINKNCWFHFDTYVHAFINSSRNYKSVFQLLNELPYLDERYLEDVRNIFNSTTLTNLPEKRKNEIWQRLVITKNKIKNETTINLVNELCNIYEPDDVFFRVKILFDQPDYELVSNMEERAKQEGEINNKLIDAVNTIYEDGGFEKILLLIHESTYIDRISYAIGKSEIRSIFLPKLKELLNSTNIKEEKFAKGLIYQICETETLVNGLEIISYDQYDKTTKLKILLCIKPHMLVWKIANNDNIENRYWKSINIHYQHIWEKEEIEYSINKLNEAKRYPASIDILSSAIYNAIDINTDLITNTMLDFTIEEGDSLNSRQSYEILEIINYLKNKKHSQYKLAMIELKFISLFEKWNHNNTPDNLRSLLGKAPEIFCAMYDMQYTEKEKSYQYYKITHELYIRPGINDQNKVTKKRLKQWINDVETHYGDNDAKLAAVRSTIGQNLASSNYHTPLSEEHYLKLLNRDENVDYRNGFSIGVINSRGVISVDEKFVEEKKLINIWNQSANEVDARGYRNVAKLYRNIAKEFQNEIDRITERIKRRSDA